MTSAIKAKTLLSQGDAEMMVKKANVRLMRHEKTSIYGGVFLLGKTIVDDTCPTAKTDGINKFYGRAFLSDLTIEQTCGLVLHENLHVMLKHIPRFRTYMAKGDPIIHAAMDYAVNSFIVDEVADPKLAQLPDGGLYDKQFKGMSVPEIYNFLKQGKRKDEEKGGGGKSGGKLKPGQEGGSVKVDGKDYEIGPMDEHDASGMEEMTEQDLKDLGEKIQEALQQSAMLAGRRKGGVPRIIGDALVPEVDWRAETQDFVTASMSGNEEYTWRRYKRTQLGDDLYLPSTESETVEELVSAMDTSGSISGEILSQWAEHLYNICMTVRPQKLRVLWWDTHVHGEQVFEPDNFDGIKHLLKPQGGGGTHAGCVAQYLKDQDIHANCIVVLTDGWTEQPIKWDIQTPTLWLVTQNAKFQAPVGGRIVKFNS